MKLSFRSHTFCRDLNTRHIQKEVVTAFNSAKMVDAIFVDRIKDRSKIGL